MLASAVVISPIFPKKSEMRVRHVHIATGASPGLHSEVAHRMCFGVEK